MLRCREIAPSAQRSQSAASSATKTCLRPAAGHERCNQPAPQAAANSNSANTDVEVNRGELKMHSSGRVKTCLLLWLADAEAGPPRLATEPAEELCEPLEQALVQGLGLLLA